MTKLTDEEVKEHWDRLHWQVRGFAYKHYKMYKEQYPTYLDLKREVVEEFLEGDPSAFASLPAVRVFLSRHSDELKSGMGESIDWEIGETVEIISGIDKGRLFIVESKGMSHEDAPGEYVREGRFVDGRNGRVAKRESQMWFPSS